ncbi:MAG: glucokinase [Rubrivivax sp.]|nr:glucokinase [Rubrivivax sp.]
MTQIDSPSTAPGTDGTAAPGPSAGLPQGLPRPWLVADIGGTNVRFGWLDAGAAAIEHVATMAAASHAGPAAAAAIYLQQVAQKLGSRYRAPRAGAFAVATAVGGDRVELTNSHWAFSRRAVQRELGLQALLVLNDFEALALSLPRLKGTQIRPFGAAPVPVTSAAAHGTLAVIGPGTGLGVAGLVPTRHGWVAVPGEGGHASLAASDDFEAALLAAVRHHHVHVSAERLLSGIGLPLLHAAVAHVLGQAAAPLSTVEIVERGLGRHDAVCSRTLDSFCALLGGFAGNVALVLGARGGVYIGGGIVPRLGERFFASRFRERFEAKGRFQDYLQAIPTALITDTLAALTGAALALEQHDR